MTNEMFIDALIGFVMPGLIALVNQPTFSPRLKGVIALVSSVVAAVLTEWVRGDLDWGAGLRSTVLVVGAATFAFYRLWWRPTLWAPTIEAMTSPGRTVVRTPEG